MSESRLIVGLGNPGKEHERTRHNLGFLALRKFAERHGIKFRRSVLSKSFIAEGSIDGKKVFLVLPLTYMNNSGTAVKAAVRQKKISPENMLVISDDLNLDFGVLRLKAKGSDGGHHGLHSVIQQLNTNEFARLRLGIGSPRNKEDTVDFVLSGFNVQERKRLEDFLDRAVHCCEVWLKNPISEAMNQFNKKENT